MRPSISFVRLSRRMAVLMFLLFMTTVTYAQITPSADAYISSASPKANYGADTVLRVNGATGTAFIQFNLASIPPGAVVSQATLKLFVDSVITPGSFNVNYVSGPWSEGALSYELAPAIGGTIAANVPITTEDKNQYILINLTTAVQAWLKDSEANNGIVLVANGAFHATFDSKENAGTAHAPQLDIVFAAGSSLQLGDNNLVCVGTPLTAAVAGEGSALNIRIHCSPGGGGGGDGTGTVTSVGLTAPSTDFIVTGSPVTTSGTLGLGWLVAPDFNNTPGAIVKRDSSGNFSAGTINAATGFNLGGNVFDQGSYANLNAFLGFAGNVTMTGIANTASGYQALSANTTGKGNVAYGVQALAGNSTASGNTALGGHALFANTTGASNTASGAWALYSATTAANNTANGDSALYTTTTGGNNTATGYQALYSNNTGAGNTAVGNQAISSNNVAGNYLTCIGYDCGVAADGLTNATAVGAYAQVAESNAMVLGSINGVNGSTANTNVGIGTTTPAYALDVHGTGNFTGLVSFASGQTFPGAGSITGVTTAPGSGLTGGGTSGTVNLSIPTGGVSDAMLANPSLTVLPGTDLTGGGSVLLGGSVTLNLDITKVPQLGAANTFNGNQTVNGTVTATSFSGNGAGLTNLSVPTPGAMNAALLRWYSKTYSVGNTPEGVAFDGSNVWVANETSNTVTKLLASSGAVVGTYTVGSTPQGVAFDGSDIWVANFGSNTVTKLLASSGAVVGTYTVGTGPFGLAFDGTNIWVANSGDNTVTELSASTGAVVGTYFVGTKPLEVAFDGFCIWVVNNASNTVTRLSPNNGTVVGTYSVGSGPAGVAFDGTNIWVANYNSDSGNTVTKLLAGTGALLGTYTVGTGPFGLAFDGTNIWVANSHDNTVTKLLASSGAQVGTYSVSVSPIGLAFDGSNIWVTNAAVASVTNIPVN